VILRGAITAVLIDESRHAAMVCVGSSGVDYPVGKSLGSVAAAMARSAYCPSAVVRAPNVGSRESHCVAAIVGDPNTADAVLRVAMDEARLRTASLLILRTWPATRGSACDDHVDRRMILWRRRYPDVDVHPVAYPNLAGVLTESAGSLLVAIVDTVSGDETTRIVGPSVVSRAQCSVIVVDPVHGRRPPAQRRPVNGSLRRSRTLSSPTVVGQVV
jgi:hypothetical protein